MPIPPSGRPRAHRLLHSAWVYSGWVEVRLIYSFVAITFFGLTIAVVLLIAANKNPDPVYEPTQQQQQQWQLRDEQRLQAMRQRGAAMAQLAAALVKASSSYALDALRAEPPLATLYQWQLSYPWPGDTAALLAGQWISAPYRKDGSQASLLSDLQASKGIALTAMDDGRLRLQLSEGQAEVVRYAVGSLQSQRIDVQQQTAQGQRLLEIMISPSDKMEDLRLGPPVRFFAKDAQALLVRAKKIHRKLGTGEPPGKIINFRPPTSKRTYDRRLGLLRSLEGDWRQVKETMENLIAQLQKAPRSDTQQKWLKQLRNSQAQIYQTGPQLDALLNAPYVPPRPKRDEVRPLVRQAQ